MAHKKGQGSTRNGRDSNPQFRGLKRFGGESVSAGTIMSAYFIIAANAVRSQDLTIGFIKKFD